MKTKLVLGLAGITAGIAVVAQMSVNAQGINSNKSVYVRVDCLANRGVSFTLAPWTIEVREADSLSWTLSDNSSVSEMDIIEKKDNKKWPFKKKPPYKVEKNKPNGARGLDPNENQDKYSYAVRAVCPRADGEADTLIIDPDMIIIRGGGT